MLENRIHLYHIAYSEETLRMLPQNFLILDNLSNERPDWFEYWPIRNFLNTQDLIEDHFYGFFSPKFRIKTGLDANMICNFINSDNFSYDCYLFSPQPDMGAFFLNVFEQGETFDNGTIHTIKAILKEAGIDLNVDNLVMDSRTIVFSNYFVARPKFWREWLDFNELIFRHAEDELDELGKLLRTPTAYGDGVQRKVFIQERAASLILMTNKDWKSKRYNPFKLAWSGTPLNQFPVEAIISDALKIAFNETHDPEYISAFANVRDRLINKT